ncbi:MAG: FAD-dependent oxidoreductase [Rhodocyclaceae bacterium]
MKLDRRHFLAASGALAAGTAMAQATSPLPFFINTWNTPLMPPAKGRKRVVIAGGGWGGISAAKHLKLNDPNLEVVVLERNPVFFSCPMSNKWLVDIVNAEYLTQSYLKTADKFGYTFVQTEVTGFERDKKRVITAQGWIDYDYLIVAAGIRYNYETWFGNDRRAADYTKANYPAAYIPTAEHFTLKRGIQEFKGGDLVMTLPPPPHRCPPSPYERACLIAAKIKKEKIKGRVIILDPKESPRPITEGFQEAFANLYKDQITYVPKAVIKEVDPFNKKIVTSAGDFRFDHSILMAPHQAGDMAWKAGTIGRNAEGKPTGWAGVDPLFLNLKDDPDTYVIGDAVGVVSPQFNFYPKAGHVANAHGKIVARYIADRAAGRQPKADLPDNLCFMMVNLDPIEDIAVRFKYHINEQGIIIQDQYDDNFRSADMVQEDFGWAAKMYGDMFGA